MVENHGIEDSANEADLSKAISSVGAKRAPKASAKAAAAKAVAQATAAQITSPLELGTLKPVKVTDVVVGARARKDLGDLRSLARSMSEVGLAQPILLDARLSLICGYRRYRAAESLGWETIDARVVDIDDPTELMIAEDACRKPLNSSEKYAIWEAVRERARSEEYRRGSFGGRLETAEAKGRLDEEIGKALGISRESLRKVKAIHDAARADAETFGDLVELLDGDGRVDRHYRALVQRQGRGGASRAEAIVVAPGWEAALEGLDPVEFGKRVKARLLGAGADAGTVLLLPTSVPALSTAASLLSQGVFGWRETLRGSGADGERLWLFGVHGRKETIAAETVALLAEGCAQGADAALSAAESAFRGQVRALDLAQEVGA